MTVQAAYSKHRREDVLSLRLDTAAILLDFLARKLPDAPAFNPPKYRPLSEVIREDLEAARVAWLQDAPTAKGREAREATRFLCFADSAGQVADFHSLRHTTGTWHAAAGTHPKVAQSIMRHSSIDLTMSRYTHTLRGQESDAMAALPNLGTAPVKQSARATGTDNAAAQDAIGRPRTGDHAPGRPMASQRLAVNTGNTGTKNSASYLARKDSFSCTSSQSSARNAHPSKNDETPAPAGANHDSQGIPSLRPTGIEPVTCGLGNHRQNRRNGNISRELRKTATPSRSTGAAKTPALADLAKALATLSAADLAELLAMLK